MKIKDGFKMMDLADILKAAGGRPIVCSRIFNEAEALLNLFDRNEYFTLKTGVGENLEVFHLDKAYQFYLIPKEMFEEKLITHATRTAMAEIAPLIDSEFRLSKIDQLIEQHHEYYEDMVAEFDLKDNPDTPCYVFAMADGRIEDVFTSTLASLVSVITRPVPYEIIDGARPKWVYADPTNLDASTPKIFYRENEEGVFYFEYGVDGLKRVGER